VNEIVCSATYSNPEVVGRKPWQKILQVFPGSKVRGDLCRTIRNWDEGLAGKTGSMSSD